MARYLLMFSVLFSTLFTSVSTVYAAPVSIRVGSAEGSTGSNIVIPVTVEGARDLGAFQSELVFDQDIIELVGIDAGPLLEGSLLDFNSGSPGKVKIGFVKLEGVNGNGVLFKVNFTVSGENGASTSLQLQDIGAWEQESHSEILIRANAGRVEVRESLLSPMHIGVGVVVFLVLIGFIGILKQRKPKPVKQVQMTPPVMTPPVMAPPEQPPPVMTTPEGPSPGTNIASNSGQHVFCSECGFKNVRSARFCSECGKPIAKNLD